MLRDKLENCYRRMIFNLTSTIPHSLIMKGYFSETLKEYDIEVIKNGKEICHCSKTIATSRKEIYKMKMREPVKKFGWRGTRAELTRLMMSLIPELLVGKRLTGNEFLAVFTEALTRDEVKDALNKTIDHIYRDELRDLRDI